MIIWRGSVLFMQEFSKNLIEMILRDKFLMISSWLGISAVDYSRF
jgi:hypothetical protein